MNRLTVRFLLAAVILSAFPFPFRGQTLTVTSDILGMCDTGNKTTLKKDLIYTHGPGDINLYHYDSEGKRVIYENEKELCIHLDPVRYSGQALFDLGNVDDKLIDCSEAGVAILEGNVNGPDEFILKATRLDGEWKDGKYRYTLSEGDLEFNTWGYDTSGDYNSSREWSIMGGDGAGVYPFRFEVSGIKYDGKEVPPAVFPVTVYCYGRSCTDMALGTAFIENSYDPSYRSGIAPARTPQWKWFTEGGDSMADKPYMNDQYTDYFTLVWPEGTDASGINAADVSVVLGSEWGDTYVLSTETPYGEHEYAVLSGKEETTVCVMYQQWRYVPIYDRLSIEIRKDGDVVGTEYEIASVGVYGVQTGGGGVDVDHTLTCYNYYGLEGMTMDNAIGKSYTLSTVIDGQTFYYGETSDGKGYLIKAESNGQGGPGRMGTGSQRGQSGPAPSGGTMRQGPGAGSQPGGPGGSAGPGGPGGNMGQRGMGGASVPADAWKGDATGIYGLAVLGNVVFVQTRMDTPEEKVTTEDKVVDGKTITFTRNREQNPSATEMLRNGATLKKGYNNIRSAASKWAWTDRYQSGWTIYSPEPEGLPENYPYGYAPGGENPAYSYEKSLTSAR